MFWRTSYKNLFTKKDASIGIGLSAEYVILCFSFVLDLYNPRRQSFVTKFLRKFLSVCFGRVSSAQSGFPVVYFTIYFSSVVYHIIHLISSAYAVYSIPNYGISGIVLALPPVAAAMYAHIVCIAVDVLP